MRFKSAAVNPTTVAPDHSRIVHRESLRPDRNDPPVNLGDLPTEIICEICDSLRTEDLLALRLTNRILSCKATTQAFRNACRFGRCQLDGQGLASFKALTRAGGQGCSTLVFIISGIAVASKRRFSLWERSTWQREARRKAKAENAILDEELLACRQFQASDHAVHSLKECFDSLDRHRPSDNKPIHIELQVETFDVRDGATSYARIEFSKYSTSSAIRESAARTFRTVIRALLNSSLSVRVLCLRDPVLISTFDDVDWNNETRTGLEYIKVLEVRLTTDKRRLERRGPLGTNLEKSQECRGLRRFLSTPSTLHCLNLMYHPVRGQYAGPPTAPDSVFNTLLDLKNWDILVACGLHGLDMSQDKLLIFVTQCPLLSLMLYDVNLKATTSDHDQSAWQELLEHPTFEISTVMTVIFTNVSVNGRLDNDTSGKFIRPAGPYTRFEHVASRNSIS